MLEFIYPTGKRILVWLLNFTSGSFTLIGQVPVNPKVRFFDPAGFGGQLTDLILGQPVAVLEVTVPFAVQLVEYLSLVIRSQQFMEFLGLQLLHELFRLSRLERSLADLLRVHLARKVSGHV